MAHVVYTVEIDSSKRYDRFDALVELMRTTDRDMAIGYAKTENADVWQYSYSSDDDTDPINELVASFTGAAQSEAV